MHGIRHLSTFRKATLAMGVVFLATAVLFTSFVLNARAAPAPDTTRPTVLSIVAIDPNPHALGAVRWTVTFSEAVTGVALSAFSLQSTGLGNGPTLVSLSPAAGPASVYTVTAHSGTSPSAPPSMRLDITKSPAIKDVAGNLLANALTGATYTFTTYSPTVTLTKVNGSTSLHGSTIVFPLTTSARVDTIGGTCGTVAGDRNLVTVTITGPTNRSGTPACSAGTWSFTLSPPLLNSPVGINDGDYTITVTQAGAGGSLGTTGPRVLTMATLKFTVSGNAATPLAPGRASSLNLTITNPYNFALRLETLTVDITGTDTCGAANFEVSRAFNGPVTVPPGSSALSTLAAPQIRMRNLATLQDACKLTTISLAYNGMASRA